MASSSLFSKIGVNFLEVILSINERSVQLGTKGWGGPPDHRKAWENMGK